MKLKRLYASKELIPDGYADLYEQTDEGWVFAGTEDAGFKGKLDEFRTNNVQLRQQVEALTKKIEEHEDRFKDVDPERYRKGLEALQQVDDDRIRQMLADGRIEDVVDIQTEQRIKTAKQEFESQIQALKDANTELREQSGALRSKVGVHEIDNDLRRAIEKKKLKPRHGAWDDIVARTRSVFVINEKGERVPQGQDGKPIYGKDAETLLTLDDHVDNLFNGASHLFEPGEGGDAAGGRRGAGAGGRRRVADTQEGFEKNIDKIAAGEVELS